MCHFVKGTQTGIRVYFRDTKSIEQRKTWRNKTAGEAGTVILTIHPLVFLFDKYSTNIFEHLQCAYWVSSGE